MTIPSATNTPLHRYLEHREAFYSVYESYEPDLEAITQLTGLLPAAHVVIPCQYSCPDCIRNVPRMARIAEHLEGWTWDIFESGSDAERMVQLHITHLPTFIVFDMIGGRELGRIVENPSAGSLECDLLGIARLAFPDPG